MTDLEKVIKGLEICSEHGSWHGLDCELNEAYKDCPYRGCETGCIVTIAKDAIKLLKEQEAKQIVRKQRKKEHEDGSIDYFAEWYCPHCSSLIARGFDNPSIKFCYKCGKPILWEGR